VPHAQKAAQDLYGCRGVCFPLQTDAWGRATPESHGWAVWIGAAAWLAQHVWWHYEFSPDRKFLDERGYPFLKEVARFFEDYLMPDESGTLHVVPSQSPENRIVGGGDLPVTLCVSSTSDVWLVDQALKWAAESARILGVDEEDQQKWEEIRTKLPPMKIGQHGQLQEWFEDDEEAEPGHRHVSHLLPLYPGDTLDPKRTPELWRAAEVSLERRLAAGGGHTGWSRAWTACLFAKLGRAEEAYEHLKHLILDFATDSMLDLHPPHIFQVEGNLGGVAAVVEMLINSDRGELTLLPSLPADWPEGEVHGLGARGGLTLSMGWSKGELSWARIEATHDGPCVIADAPSHLSIRDSAGSEVACQWDQDRLGFFAQAGGVYELTVGGGARQS
jgi:alpha-L-fucosidase 2